MKSELRRYTQYVMGALFPVVLIGGLFYPRLGLLVGVLMVGFVVLSFFKGRLWCGYMCPRGGFLERYFVKMSRNKRVPKLLKLKSVRIGVFAGLMSAVSLQFYVAPGTADGIGAVFIRACLITSVIAFGLGYVFKPRTWCAVCPMGLVQGILGQKRATVSVDSGCKSCHLCTKACPINTPLPAYKTAFKVSSWNCIQCKTCVAVCPIKAVTVSG